MGAATLTRTITEGTDIDRHDARLAAGGDASAFERLYRRHVARVHTLCRRMLSPGESDDAAQEVFIRAWQKLALFRGESAFGTWLHRLAVNVILARRQRDVRYHDRFGGEVEAERSTGRRERPDLRMDMEAAIGTLPPGAQAIFVLHDVEGYTHEEIAEMLDISPGTSKSQLHRARMSLRQYLK
ncbi:MAG TPA: RNA polymerase sigma factor [Longimicrobiales bacterium]|nr:RNA polymerase sigma factor [Longimicrobiales bacterium]